MGTIFDDEKFGFNKSADFHAGRAIDDSLSSATHLNAGWNKFAKKDNRPGASGRDWIDDRTWDCRQSSDCGVNFSCIGGECVRTRPGGAAAGVGSGASTSCEEAETKYNNNNESCGSYNQSSSSGCSKPSCGDESDGSSRKYGSSRKCCGGEIYSRTGAIPGGGLFTAKQCEPFKNGDQCLNYCNAFYGANGYHVSGCTDNDICLCGGPCINGGCVDDANTTKCYCRKPKCKETCYNCKNNGTCELDCTDCKITCTGFYKCPCADKTYRITQSQAMCAPGVQKSCPQLVRERGEEICSSIHPCPPSGPGNSCTTQQVNGTTLDCKCYSREETCNPGGSYATSFCADSPIRGENTICYDKGYIHVSNVDYPSPTPGCPDGGTAVLFGKVCETNRDFGCHKGGCPTGYNCNEEGNCEVDNTTPTCNGPVCEGICCSAGAQCVPYRKYYVADNCHNQGTTFFAPQSPAPTLEAYEFISKENSVCGRAHSHCSVKVGFKAVATHLSCEEGIVDLGPAGTGCSSLDE
jgi:hypothetical protein